MRLTAFHSAAMATKIIDKLQAVKETVNVALMVSEQEDRENIPPTNHAKYAAHGEEQSEVLPFLK